MKICILGGGGYVGTELTSSLLSGGHEVTILETFWFGDHLPRHPRLTKFRGDIRKVSDLKRAINGQDAVIHLACVSNDPCFDMNPSLGRSINYSCFKDCLTVLQTENVKRFIYASSSSVYGVSALSQVKEDSHKNPVTDYSKFKLKCEEELADYGMGGTWTILRPATVCGYSRRQRLDLVVNILTMQAITGKKITLFGRDQKRPNINIKDMVASYEFILGADERLIDQKTFNVGFENLSLYQIANLVRNVVDRDGVDIEEQPMNDPRSYHINSDKILDLGFEPKYSIEEAVESLKEAHKCNLLRDPMNNSYYYNNRRMKEIGVQ